MVLGICTWGKPLKTPTFSGTSPSSRSTRMAFLQGAGGRLLRFHPSPCWYSHDSSCDDPEIHLANPTCLQLFKYIYTRKYHASLAPVILAASTIAEKNTRQTAQSVRMDQSVWRLNLPSGKTNMPMNVYACSNMEIHLSTGLIFHYIMLAYRSVTSLPHKNWRFPTKIPFPFVAPSLSAYQVNRRPNSPHPRTCTDPETAWCFNMGIRGSFSHSEIEQIMT